MTKKVKSILKNYFVPCMAVVVIAFPVVSQASEPEFSQDNTTGPSHTITGETENSNLGDSAGTLGAISEDMDADLDDVFASMKVSLENGDMVSLSGAISLWGDKGVSTDAFYDLSGMGLDEYSDIGSVNLQYGQLAKSLQGGYQSASLSMESADCISLLNAAYGDLVSQYQLDSPTIPEGFSASGFIEEANAAINRTYQDAISSSQLASVKSSINTSGIFTAAAQGMESGMPSLSSSSSLSSALASVSASNKKAMEDEYYQARKEADGNKADWGDDLERAEDSMWEASDKTPLMDVFTGKEDSALGKVFGFVQDTTTGLFDNILDPVVDFFEGLGKK